MKMKANCHMNNRQSNQKSQTKRIYFVLSVLLLALIFVANANKTYAQTGIMVGSDQLILNNADNLYYGVMGESSNAGASALLLQRPAGSNIFRVDPYGNVISAGNVGGAGLCMGSDCRTSWADVVSDSSFWQLSGTNLFASSTAWNVGIGKTNPNYKLDVNGGINAAYGSSGGYYINTNQIIMQNSQTMNFGWVSSNRSYFQAAYLGPGNTEASIITNGYKRLTVNSAGNVGIGITNPSAMLTVNGNTLLGGATQISPLGGAGQVLVMADNTGTLYATSSAALLPPGSVSLPSGTSGQTLRHDGTVWTADSNLFNNGTRIGIGTTNPGSGIPYDTKLHIRGSGTSTSGRTAFVVENTSANSAAIFQLRNSSGNTLSVQLSGPSYTIGERANFGASADIWFSTDGDMSSGGTHTVNFSAGGYNNGATMTITPGNPGNVGIGTTSPNVKLNVVDGTPAGTYTGLYTGMVFDGSNVGEYLHIKTTDGGSLSSGIILGSGNKNWYINAKGPTSNNNFDLGYRAETADGFTPGGSTLFSLTTSGNVGIGITNPSALLTVNGSTILGGATQITPLGGAGNVLVMADNTGILYSTSTAAIVSPIVSSASGWTASGTTVYKTDNNGNVGIGNTNPNYKLIVSESNSSRNTLRDVLALESTVSGPYINFGQGLVFRSRTYSNNEIHDKARIRTLASDHSTATTGISLIFEVATSSNSTVTSEVMRITHNGDVGIGTTVPNYKLEIVGTDKNLLTIRNANNAADTEATLGFKMTTYTGETNYAEIGAIRGNWSDVSHIVFRTRHSSALAERIRINSAGNLGIGVSNPSARLTVNGNTVLGGATQISALGGGGNLLVMTDDAGNLYSTSTSAVIPEAMPIGTSGQTIRHNGSAWVANGNLFNNGTNVGIGTTAPSARLDVAGTLAIKSEGQLPDRITGGSGMILSGYNPTGSVIGRIFIGDGSGYTFNFATRNNGVTSDKVSIQSLGNVGIGITNPSARLTVNGNTILGGATQITPLGGAGNVMVMADNTGTLYATTTAILAGDYLSLSGGTMAGDINLGGNDISNINKLTVNTIDPLYRIKGVNYSSFAAAIVGGVKEEYVGKAQINKLNFKGEYEFILDFAKQKEGSDLWVWYKTVDFSAENVDALVTNYGNFAQVYYLIEGEKLIFRASEPTTISYRLIGRRHDWRNWPTRAIDQNQTAGFVID